jgi:signal transduction histidine kinase
LSLLALSPREAVIIAATASTVLVVLATLWPLGSALRDRRAEADRLVFLGHVSDQLAHDVRNPLSAIVGAADFLRVEWRDAPESTHEMLDTVATEARRIAATLDVYRRLSDMAPQREPADLGALAARALRNVRGDAPFAVETDLPETLASIDPALVLPALENLLRNAIEATAGSGRVRLSVAREAQLAWVRVADDGPGLTPEDEAWVTRSYFTTKAHGLGLGLALVKRVVDAHRGVLRFGRSDMGGLEVELAFEGVSE